MKMEMSTMGKYEMDYGMITRADTYTIIYKEKQAQQDQMRNL